MLRAAALPRLDRLRRRWLPAGGARRLLLQSGVALAGGVLLGALAVLAASLPPRYLMLVLAVVAGGTVVVVFGHLRRLVLTAIVLDIPLQIDGNLFYQEGLAALGAIGGLSISLTGLGLAVLYLLWALDWLTGRHAEGPPVTRPWVGLSLLPLLYVALLVVSILVAQNLLLATFEAALMVEMLLLFIYIVAHTHTREDVYFIVTLLLVGLLIEGAIMVTVMLLGHGIDLFITQGDYDRGRIGGTLGSPIIAAGYLELLLVPALAVLVARPRLWLRLLAFAALTLGGIGMIATFSRGGWLALTISGSLFLLLAQRRGLIGWRIPLLMSLVAVGLGLLFREPILARIFGGDGGSAASRLPLIRVAVEMIRANPFGVGANNFAVHLRDYALVERADVWLYTVHNKYILVWAETGPAALLAFVGFLVVTLRRGWQSWRAHDPHLSPLALALALAILGNMVHMLVDVFHSRGVVELLWVNAALITAIYAIVREERRPAEWRPR